MSVPRSERLNSLLKRVLADAIFRIMQSDGVNPALFTVTSVNCAKDMHDATVRVSVFGTPPERHRAFRHLVRHAHEFQSAINNEVRMKFTPRLRFVMDESLEKGDRVLAALDRLEHGLSGDVLPPEPLPPPKRRESKPVFEPL